MRRYAFVSGPWIDFIRYSKQIFANSNPRGILPHGQAFIQMVLLFVSSSPPPSPPSPSPCPPPPPLTIVLLIASVLYIYF